MKVEHKPEWMKRKADLEAQAEAAEKDGRCPKSKVFREEVCGYSGATAAFTYQCLLDRDHGGDCVHHRDREGRVMVEQVVVKGPQQSGSSTHPAGDTAC